MKHVTSSLFALAFCAALPAQFNICTTELDGDGCGPALDVIFTPGLGGAGNHKITVAASGMHVGGVGLMAWGQQAINVPVFGNCFAYTDFIWGHQVNPDAAGSWNWSRSWPNSVQASYRIQIASLGLDAQGQLEITTTDCIVATCTL